MKLNYYPDTDSLYIDLSAKTSVESIEVSEGVVLGFDAEGNLVGMDIDNASMKLDLDELTLSRLPVKSTTFLLDQASFASLRSIRLPAKTHLCLLAPSFPGTGQNMS